MQVREYRESAGESWLNRARVIIVEDIEHRADKSQNWRRHMGRIMQAKLHCLAAFFTATYELVSAAVRTLWHSGMRLFSARRKQRREQALDDLYRALDSLFDSLTGLVSIRSILTAADRDNIKRIGKISQRIQDLGSFADLHPETERELHNWYQSAKVFVKQGGEAARREMKGLSEVLDRLVQTPSTRPDKLRGWRWEKKQHGLIKLEKLKGIRWSQEEPKEAVSLGKHKWTVGAASKKARSLPGEFPFPASSSQSETGKAA